MPTMTKEHSTANDFFVSVNNDDIIFLMPIPARISREKALNLAAWIVALADVDDEFDDIFKKVQNT